MGISSCNTWWWLQKDPCQKAIKVYKNKIKETRNWSLIINWIFDLEFSVISLCIELLVFASECDVLLQICILPRLACFENCSFISFNRKACASQNYVRDRWSILILQNLFAEPSINLKVWQTSFVWARLPKWNAKNP